MINDFGDWIVGAGALGAFAYGIANRALLPMGLHHILNPLVWFQFGTYTTPDGEEVSGDLTRYLNGDPQAGLFMAGWFFIMMFGLPAAAYAMYRAAERDQKKATGAVMGSTGFTSFLAEDHAEPSRRSSREPCCRPSVSWPSASAWPA